MRRKIGRQTLVESRYFYLLVSPWVIGYLVFTLFPIAFSFYLTFHEYNVLRPARYIGVGNYIAMANDSVFWKSVSNSAFYTLIHVPSSLAVSLILALLLNEDVPGVRVFRAAYYIPSIIPIVSNSMMWIWIFNLRWGVLNILLRAVGLKAIPWLGHEVWAKPALNLMSLWWTGTNMIIYLAALKGVPKHLYEAAEVDGATAWKKFWMITVPMISPTILFTVIMGIIGSFQVFAQANIMTQGGPQDATRFMVVYIYDQAFRWLHFGYGAGIAWVLFVIVLILTVAVFRSSVGHVYYEFDERKR